MLHRVTVFGPGYNWNCGFSFTSSSRIDAFRKVKAAVAKIPDAAIRPTDEELDDGYASLAKWDKSTRSSSPRMSHEPSSRRWNLTLERITEQRR
jgi:hypothetical protein